MNIEAFILIGGRSSRLGVNKAFVELGGETLARRAARIVAGVAPARTTFVTAAEDQFAAEHLFELDTSVVCDLKPGFGAWSGLHASLAYARSEWIFVLACDLPFVSAELLQLIAASANEEFECVVALQRDGWLQPLCALYCVEPSLAVVERIFETGNSLPSLASISDRLKTRVIEPREYESLPNSDRFFLNVNTPADLKIAALE